MEIRGQVLCVEEQHAVACAVQCDEPGFAASVDAQRPVLTEHELMDSTCRADHRAGSSPTSILLCKCLPQTLQGRVRDTKAVSGRPWNNRSQPHLRYFADRYLAIRCV